MRNLSVLTLILSSGCCPGPAASTDDSTTAHDSDTDTGLDATWATVSSCDALHSGGFNDWVGSGGRAIMVSGTSADDQALASDMHDYYASLVGDHFSSFELVSAADLTEEDRQASLFILGEPDTQPLLAELDGDLPVRFSSGSFVVGGSVWSDPADGIALDSPSPFNADVYVLVFAGNSYDGAYNTFTVETGRDDYDVVDANGSVASHGDLCTDTSPWSVVD